MAVVEMHGRARRGLVDARDLVAEPHRVVAQPLADGVEQHLVQVGAMDRELRPVVAGIAAAQVADDVLSVAL